VVNPPAVAVRRLLRNVRNSQIVEQFHPSWPKLLVLVTSSKRPRGSMIVVELCLGTACSSETFPKTLSTACCQDVHVLGQKDRIMYRLEAPGSKAGCGRLKTLHSGIISDLNVPPAPFSEHYSLIMRSFVRLNTSTARALLSRITPIERSLEKLRETVSIVRPR
jgi:hypothetical protein